MTVVLKVDGRDYSPLHITGFSLETELLDGAATGRMQARGWPLFRQPRGLLKNITLQFAPNNSANELFVDFIQLLNDFGGKDFRQVYFRCPEQELTQEMYGLPGTLATLRIDAAGICYYDSFTVSFIAKEAML